MGFCRRCGDIVVGARCKCGGTAVAPVVPWNQSTAAPSAQDKWSKTYVHRARSVSPTRPLTTQTTGTAPSAPQASPTKRFPRPISQISSSASSLGSRVTAHITSSTSQSSRPPSPLKYSNTVPAPEDDILPSLHDTTLSKVYGSVLQPKETLTTHSCAICSSPFPPDATIYPDPESPSTSRFLCRSCYEVNGGTKGGFVHAAGQYWHKKCFNCSGCFKNIGDSPMVDLLGRPSCADCFESCLKRDPATPKKNKSISSSNSPIVGKARNPGGMSSSSKDRQSREGSPAIEELEQRLGITKSRDGSPALEDLTRRLAMLQQTSGSTYTDSSPSAGKNASTRRENTDLDRSTDGRSSRMNDSPKPYRSERMKSPEIESPRSSSKPFETGSRGRVRHQSTGSPSPAVDAIEEMKQRFMKSSQSPSPARRISVEPRVVQSTSPLRLSRSSTSLRTSARRDSQNADSVPISPLSPPMPPTPDFMSDFSDSMTQSSFSGLDSPPRNDEVGDIFSVTKVHGTGCGLGYPRRDRLDKSEEVIIEETASELGTPTRTPGSTRARTTPASRRGSIPNTSTSTPLQSKAVTSPRREVPDLQTSTSPPDLAPSSCAGCGENLFSIKGGGKYVTVPGDSANSPSMTYHVDCFTCAICNGVFSEAATGQAVFVKANGGACHVECAPPTKIVIHKMPSAGSFYTNSAAAVTTPASDSPVRRPTTTQPTHTSSSRMERPPQTAPPTAGSTSFPRFGSRITCPGCNKSVSPMEPGVVPGPQGTRWHATCLVCGGKKEAPKGFGIWRGREEKNRSEPGCGKRLDSAAKTSAEGGVWCRECLLLLGVGGSPQASPTRAPLVPSFTGSSKVMPQHTGTTTLARQFTGIGAGDPGLLRQLTGGGSSPTRSASPTKQLGARPRPKSVIGMRNSKSVDEGRGMFLVRQLTGAA
ncbi:putative protein with zinc-binding domain present in Lin-11, Isl-1, Mec-3 [Lyophyllum shimeji]|uniref:LIM zinc-binding domain-containing protein n=1 Tax=Lyophyllum shimeji TaxID=47721 RepID=A0A9P3PHZ1_LYOSH|nr:putative protein with zinc-binding domain present in Lin-11, Isl-1, Mec-3 [Lyophyllum shimeji]